MKVAVVHYHFEPGGVTRVVENTLESFSRLPDPPEFTVLSGRSYGGEKLKNVALVDGLDYKGPKEAPNPSLLRERLETAVLKSLGSAPDLWHFHNHSLGKNPALPEAINQLAEKGQALLLHIHDFAEDSRPENHQALKGIHHRLYPVGPRIQYAVLNQRDCSYLLNSFPEFKPPKILPNAIPEQPEILNPDESKLDLPENLYLYPVRAVRRKNLGELVLLAASHPDKHFANSLGPTNPEFRQTYERWKKFAYDLELPLTLGLGEKTPLSFSQVVMASNALVTTSVAEGFGLGFLEPWTFGKAVLGRDLPEITGDFKASGLSLNHLYKSLKLPLELLHTEHELDKRISSALKKIYQAYSLPLPSDAILRARTSIVHNDCVEFGRLDESLQEILICEVSNSKSLAEGIREQAKLADLSITTVKANASAVRQNFAQESYVEHLFRIYEELAASTTGRITYVDSRKILSKFLKPENLNLLRT